MTTLTISTDLDVDLTSDVPCGVYSDCRRVATCVGSTHHPGGAVCETLPACDRCWKQIANAMLHTSFRCHPHGQEPLTFTPAWMDDAACRQLDGDLFYPDQGHHEQAARAVAVCQDCPVRRQCLDHALTGGEQWGVWGGTTPLQRQQMPGWTYEGWRGQQRRADQDAHAARVAALTHAGWTATEIAAHTGSTKDAIDRLRARRGITAGRTA